MSLKRRKWPIAVLIILLILISAVLIIGYALGVPHAWRAWQLLKETWERESLSADLTISAQQVELSPALFRTREEGLEIWSCQIQGYTFSYCDGCVFLDNGRGYDISSLLEKYLPEWEVDPRLLLLAGVRRERSDDGTAYILQTDSLSIHLTERGDTLAAIDLEFPIEGQRVHVSAQILSSVEYRPDPQVLEAIRRGSAEDIGLLMPLVEACSDLVRSQIIGGNAALSVDCGPLILSDDIGVYLVRTGERDQVCILRSGEYSYTPLDGQVISQMLPALVLEFCRSGQISDGCYRLTIDAEAVKTMCQTLVPETAQFDITYEDGLVELVTSEGRLDSVILQCGGQMPFFFTTIPVWVQLNWVLTENPILP